MTGHEGPQGPQEPPGQRRSHGTPVVPAPKPAPRSRLRRGLRAVATRDIGDLVAHPLIIGPVFQIGGTLLALEWLELFGLPITSTGGVILVALAVAAILVLVRWGLGPLRSR